jgi:hypothetical protein
MFGGPLSPSTRVRAFDSTDERFPYSKLVTRPNDLEGKLDAEVKREEREEVDRVCYNGVDVVRWESCKNHSSAAMMKQLLEATKRLV